MREMLHDVAANRCLPMLMNRRHAIAAGSALALPARAQRPFPERPLRMLVGFGAGGLTDITARALAQGMSEAMGQPVVM